MLLALVATLLPPVEEDQTHRLMAIGLTALVALAVALLPWDRLPQRAAVLPVLAYLLVIVVLRQGEGGAASGYGPLVVLPVFWLALYGTREELAAVIVGVAMIFLLPLAVAGDPLYPVNEVRKAIIWVTTASIVGFTVQRLVREVRAGEAEALSREEALREAEERFRSAFEHAPIGFALVGLDGRLLRVNRALAEMTGHAAGELVGRRLQEMAHPDDRGVDFAAMGSVLADRTRSHQSEQRYLHASGEPVWAQLSVSLVSGSAGQPLYLIAQIQDISERRRASAQLAQHAGELERSNADLAQFAYVASHDLSEPLRMVSSYLQLVDRRYGDRLDDDGREFIGFAVEGAARMKALIDGLLAYAKVGQEERPFEAVPTDGVVARTIAGLRPSLEEAGARVEVEPLPVVTGDAMQLSQMFQNLIANAVKFRRDGDQPRVLVSSRREHDRWRFSVCDNGIGISPQHSDRVFVMFQRLHPRRSYAGTGIGLAVCKKIIERHGGDIWFEPTPGGGSTFSFTLADRRNGWE